MADSQLSDTSYDMTANQRDMGGCAMFFAYLIIIAVVAYADVMFVKVMWNALPDGFLKVLAVGGAVTTGASIIVLVVGKAYWFRPGRQMLAAWAFTGIEVIVSALNTIVAYQMPHVVDPLTYWLMVLPATPFVALIGWVIIIHLDRSTDMRHKALEMKDQKDIAELRYGKLVHEARMSVKLNHLSQVVAGLNREMASPHVQAQIAQHTQATVAQILTEVTGMNAYLPGGDKMVDSTIQPVSMAQTSHLPQMSAPAPDIITPPQPRTPTQPLPASPAAEDDSSKKAEAGSGELGEDLKISSPPVSSPRTSRKRGRKSDRDAFVDDVVMYQTSGNVSATWAHLDDFRRYMNENMPTAEELAAARKRCGV